MSSQRFIFTPYFSSSCQNFTIWQHVFFKQPHTRILNESTSHALAQSTQYNSYQCKMFQSKNKSWYNDSTLLQCLDETLLWKSFHFPLYIPLFMFRWGVSIVAVRWSLNLIWCIAIILSWAIVSWSNANHLRCNNTYRGRRDLAVISVNWS